VLLLSGWSSIRIGQPGGAPSCSLLLWPPLLLVAPPLLTRLPLLLLPALSLLLYPASEAGAAAAAALGLFAGLAFPAVCFDLLT
jgi:hypothetical protein